MSLQKIVFKNKDGQSLVGRLALPAERNAHNFALFAHCFTCTKNLSAVKNISKALTAHGFGVLRFDFTGLGESEGDFEDTNFSGNVEDLLAASDYLRENYKAPSLIVGHSLGGAAVIFAASKIAEVQAIATVGAPSNPEHVTHLLKSGLEEIEQYGKAVVNLSGRDFTIKKQFVEDLQTKSLTDTVKQMRKALLVLHSPQDTTVGIRNAEEIYRAAHHPKSFVSLDGADHLMSNKQDSLYAGKVIAGWAQRYIQMPELNPLKTQHDVAASLDGEDGFTTQMKIGNHYYTADEPIKVGGNDFGPSPYELVSGGLAACTAMTIQMYAKRKGWTVENVQVHTSFSRTYIDDCEDTETPRTKVDTFTRAIVLTGDLDEKQRERIMQIADKCPVHKTLHNDVRVVTTLVS